jgi:lipid II:glycine glycyltransferase (peptidoglycan interpeptide bridge formation enzyme)
MELLLAEHQGKTIAGTLLFKFRDSYYYHFAASSKRFLTLRPNHLLLWVAIKQAHEEGYKYFNFGRSDADQTGLVFFKRRWGTKEYSLVNYFYPVVRGLGAMGNQSFSYRLATQILKRSPASLLKVGSNLFSKHLG